MQYEKEIKKIISDVMELKVDELDINSETELIGGEIGISSMDYVEIMVGIEETMDVVFDFEVRIETVGELEEFLIGEKGKE